MGDFVKHFTNAKCEQGKHKEKQKDRGCDKPTFVQSQIIGVVRVKAVKVAKQV